MKVILPLALRFALLASLFTSASAYLCLNRAEAVTPRPPKLTRPWDPNFGLSAGSVGWALIWGGTSNVWNGNSENDAWLWDDSVESVHFTNGDYVKFNGMGEYVAIEGVVIPSGIIVSSGNYTFVAGTNGTIAGESTSLVVLGGSLTINLANTYGGDTYINADARVVTKDADALGTGGVFLRGGELDLDGKAVSNDIAYDGGTLSGYQNYGGTMVLEASWTQTIGMTSAATVMTMAEITCNLADTDTSHNITYQGGTLSGYQNYGGTMTLEADWKQTIGMTSDATVVITADLTYDLDDTNTSHNITYQGGTLSGYQNYTGTMTLKADWTQSLVMESAGTVKATEGITYDLTETTTSHSIIYSGGTLAGYQNYTGTMTLEASWTQDIAMANYAAVNTSSGINYSLGGQSTNHAINYYGGTLSDYEGFRGTVYVKEDGLTLDCSTYTASAFVEEWQSLTFTGNVADFSLTNIGNMGSVHFYFTDAILNAEATYWLAEFYSGYEATWNANILANGFDWEWVHEGHGTALGLNIFAKTTSGGGGPGGNELPLRWIGTGDTWNRDTTNKVWFNGSRTGETVCFADGDDVIFGDTYKSENVTIEGVVSPGTIAVTGGNYTFVAGTNGEIAGEDTTLDVMGGTLTINLANTYGGGTVISGENTSVTIGNAQAFGTGAIVYYEGFLNFNNQAVTNDLIIRSGEDAYIFGYDNYTGTITLEGPLYWLDSDVPKFNTSASLIVGNGTRLILQDEWCGGFSLASLTVNGSLIFDMHDKVFEEGEYTLFTGDYTGKRDIIVSSYVIDDNFQYRMDYDTPGVLKLVIYADHLIGRDYLYWEGEDGKWNTDDNNRAWWGEDYRSLYFKQEDVVIFREVFGSPIGTVTIEGEVRPDRILMTGGNGTFVAGENGSIAGEDTTLEVAGGTLTMNLANTYGGGTTIFGGKVITGHEQALGTGDVTISGGELDLAEKAVANSITYYGGTLSGYGSYTGTITLEADWTQTAAMSSATMASSATVKTSEGITYNLGGTTTSHSISYNGGWISGYENFRGEVVVEAEGLTLDSTYKASAFVGIGQSLTFTGNIADFSLNYIMNVGGSVYFDFTDATLNTETTYWLADSYSGHDATWNESIIANGYDWKWDWNGFKLGLKIFAITSNTDVESDITVSEGDNPGPWRDVLEDVKLTIGENGKATLTGTSIAGEVVVAGGTLNITAPVSTGENVVTGEITVSGVAGGNGKVEVTGDGVKIEAGGSIAGGTITVTDGTMTGTMTDIHNGDKSESTLENFTGTAAIAVEGGTGTLGNVTVGAGGLTIAEDSIANVTGTVNAIGSIAGEIGSQIHVSGTLISNGGISNADINVQGGGTLKGAGNFGRSITVQSGGTHIVGNSPGIVTTDESYILEANSTAKFSFVAMITGDPVAGADYAQVIATAGFTLYEGAIFDLSIYGDNVTSLSDDLTYNIVLFNQLAIDGVASTIGDADLWLQNNLSMFKLENSMVLESARFVSLGESGEGALQISLIFAPATRNSLTWSGTGTTWNANTENKAWLSGDPATAAYFADGDDVLFKGAGNGTITIAGTVTPGTITVSGGNYTFVAGTNGKIAGEDTTLEVTGGTLTINLANTYGGGTVISGEDTIVTIGNAQAFGTGAIVYYGGSLNFNNKAVTNDLIIRSGEDAYIFGYGNCTGTITLEGSLYGFDSDVPKFNASASLIVGTGTLLVLEESWCDGFSLASFTINGTLIFDMDGRTLTEGSYTLFTGNFANYGSVDLDNYLIDDGFDYFLDDNTPGVLTLVVYAGSQPPPTGNSILWNGESGKWNTDVNNKAWWDEDENSSCFVQGDTVYFEEGSGMITIEGEMRPAGIIMSEGTYTFTGSGSIGGKSKLTVSGGSLTINTANTYTGGTVVTDGVLQLNTAKGAGSGAILLDGTVASPVILALNVSMGSIANNVEVRGVASIVTMQDAILTGTLTGTGTLTKSGDSALTVASLGKAGSALGGLIIEEGTLSLSANSKSYVGNLTIATAGILNMGLDSILNVTSSAVFADNSTLTGKGVINVNASATLRMGAGINNDGIIINLASNAGLNIGDNAITIGALGGAGTVTSTGGELTIDTSISNTGNVFSGALSGTGDIIKKGDGEQIFQGVDTGNKTYNLTVEEGTVTIKGSSSANYTARFDVVDVQSYHTLKLNGVILEANQLNLTYTGHLSVDGGSQAIVSGAFSANSDIVTGSRSKLTYSAVDEDMAAVVAATFTGTAQMDVVLDPAAFGWSNYVWQAVLTDSDSDFDLLQKIDVTRVSLTGFTKIASVIDGDTNYVEAWLGANAKNTTLHLAISDNARAGSELLWDANIQEARRERDSTEGNGALNKVMRQMDSYSKVGDSAGYSRLASAVAGSSLGGVTQALSADFRQQTTWIRNRVTQMIVNQVETPVTAVMSYYNTGGGNAPTARVIESDGKWHLWGQANAGYSHANGGSHSDEAGYRLSTVGGTVGCNLDVSQRVTVGAAFTASSGNLTNHAADSLKGKLNTNYVNLFARVQAKKWGHSIIATGGFGSTKLDRTVNVGNANYIAKGSPKTNAFGFMYELTYDYALNAHKTSLLQPIVNLSYTSNSIKNYKETGADGAGLRVSDMKANYFTLALGARAIKILDSGAWRVPGLLEGHILLAQDMGDRGNELTTGLQSGSLTRTIKGSEVGSFGVQIGGGISLEVADNTVFYINTDVDLRNKATNINASFGIRYDF